MRKALAVLAVLGLIGALLTSCAKPQPEVGPGSRAGTQVASAGQKPAEAESDELLYSSVDDLDTLKSYRAKTVMSWSEEGSAPEGVETDIAYVAEPRSQHLLMQNTGNAAGRQMEVIRIGAESYARLGEGWLAMQVPDEELLPPASYLYRPENILGSARGQFVGQETVNGVQAKHYVFSKEGLLKSGLFENVTEASGETWISTEHNVAVRSVVHLKGKDKAKDKVITLDVTRDVTEINADIEIKPPEGVAKPETPADIPIMAGASDLLVMAPMTSYKVKASAEQVIKFYSEQMPANGWKAEPATTPGFLRFAKEGRVAQIVIQAQGDQTGIAIVTEQKQ